MNAQVLTDGLAGLLHFDLPEFHGEHAPDFLTPSECKKWLAGVAITNAALAQGQLEHQIELLNRFSVPFADRLKIADLLRSPCYFVHGEFLKRFALRRPSFPMGSMEQMTFDASQSLWQGLMTAYLHCLQALLEKAGQVKRLGNGDREAAAMAASRALAIAQSVFLDHCSVGVKPEAAFWRRLHRIYLAAEILGVADMAVADKLARGSEVSPALLYVETLLLAAARPYTLRPKQLANVVYWAHRWAGKVSLLPSPPADLRTPPLCANLADALPAGFVAPSTQTSADSALRWLDLAMLRKTIKQRLLKLAAGATPQELKLGKNCTQPGCERLLRQVYGDWCKGGRRPAGEAASEETTHAYEITIGSEAIHYHLSGNLFRNPAQSPYLNKKAADEIATFGHVATRHDAREKASSNARYPLEAWQSCRESLNDIELQRPMEPAGSPLHSDGLVAVRRRGDGGFQLARLSWLLVAPDTATLHIALHLMPGVARAVTVSIPGSGAAARARHDRGYCLPAIESLQQAATVLIPAGCFRLGLVIEISDDGVRRVRLGQLLDRGVDFDRCTYDMA